MCYMLPKASKGFQTISPKSFCRPPPYDPLALQPGRCAEPIGPHRPDAARPVRGRNRRIAPASSLNPAVSPAALVDGEDDDRKHGHADLDDVVASKKMLAETGRLEALRGARAGDVCKMFILIEQGVQGIVWLSDGFTSQPAALPASSPAIAPHALAYSAEPKPRLNSNRRNRSKSALFRVSKSDR